MKEEFMEVIKGNTDNNIFVMLLIFNVEELMQPDNSLAFDFVRRRDCKKF